MHNTVASIELHSSCLFVTTLYIYMTLNVDLEPKIHHQTPMTCTYVYSHFIHFKTIATEVEIQFLSTLLFCCHSWEVPFSLLKKECQYFHIMNVQVIGVW